MAATEHTGIHCVRCDREKRGENHWLRVLIGTDSFTIGRLDDLRLLGGGPICGGQCAQSVWAQWLASFFEMKHANPLPDPVLNSDSQADGVK